MNEARARITWGDAPDTVYEWLLAEKVSRIAADEIVRGLVRDRGASMRKRGLTGIALGSGALVIAVAIVAVPFLLNRFVGQVDGQILGLFFAGAALAGMYGVHKLVDGLERLTRGSRATGADSDVEE